MKSVAKIKACVIGHPVGHSLSPLLHNHWIKQHGFPAEYSAVDIAPGQLSDGVQRLINENYIGFNVTLPYKQDIIELCDSIDETARRIGAVNMVVVRENGKLRGFNTDSFGFVENILQEAGDVNLRGGTALVLGAGGAARAIVHGLLGLGLREIRIANRSRGKAEEIGATFPIKTVDWQDREEAAQGAAILVNTTALGMAGQPELGFDLQHLPATALVCDIVYKPLETALLKAAKARGNPIVTGIGMLLHQARPAFREWFGIMPEVDGELRQKILKGAQ